jgi:hypothetical protein
MILIVVVGSSWCLGSFRFGLGLCLFLSDKFGTEESPIVSHGLFENSFHARTVRILRKKLCGISLRGGENKGFCDAITNRHG